MSSVVAWWLSRLQLEGLDKFEGVSHQYLRVALSMMTEDSPLLAQGYIAHPDVLVGGLSIQEEYLEHVKNDYEEHGYRCRYSIIFKNPNIGTKAMKHQLIEWKHDYELGIEDIDFQHHFFVKLINRIANELAMTSDLNYQGALINELHTYACFHFMSEENMMYRAGYPDLEKHRNFHHELIDKISDKQCYLFLNRSSKDIEKTSDFLERIIDFLLNWFLSHTMNEDKLFADYLKSR